MQPGWNRGMNSEKMVGTSKRSLRGLGDNMKKPAMDNF
jgi:hypothetical protein